MGMFEKGIVFSGGGARCAAQLGALKFFEEQNISFGAVSGASGGAIVGAYYAKGFTSEEIFLKLKSIKYKELVKLNLFRGSLFHLEYAREYLDKDFAGASIEDLPNKFIACVVDYQSGEVKYIEEGNVASVLMASSALTPVFAPIKHMKNIFIDGGFGDNLPVAPLRKICKKIVGINVNPVSKTVRNTFVSNTKRALFLMFNANTKESKKLCDFYIECEKMKGLSIFDTKIFDGAFEIGYEEAKNSDIKALVS